MVIHLHYTKEIPNSFRDLNSYDFDADIFKLEKSNVWFYGISYKIHVLYDYDDKCTIHKFTLHGLECSLDVNQKAIVT
jgi:hypothetical protein